jgi:hypothetical protein
MRRAARMAFLTVAAAALFSSVASGYYHYVHFAGRLGPFVPMYEKYDLNALPDKTVYYFISDQGPSKLAPGDTLAGLLSEIRQVGKIWNDVSSSDLRVAFGGLSSSSTQQTSPGIDIVFDDDIPPGIWALGGVTSVAAPVVAADGTGFVPIQRGVVRIRRDLSSSPSFGERAFRTMVHEFGHALGLQHTFTSGVMSTEITRAATRAKPLSDDDIAGLSILYPTGSFLAQTGTITGRVTADGSGVSLASVVAISANGPAVSALTNPDGTYTLRGIPPGSYFLYAHPLPPAIFPETWPGNVIPPMAPDGSILDGRDSFDTQFYPGTRDLNSAATLFIRSGETKTGYDFAVSRRAAPAISSVSTYGYYGNTAVAPAPVVGTTRGATLVARGSGLVNADQSLASGLSVRVLADSGANIPQSSVKYYTAGYIQFAVYPGFGWSPGPRHLLFATNDDIYVLPAGVLLVANQGPQITSVQPVTDDSGNRAAIISGINFDATTRIFFDGARAAIRAQNPDGTLLVTPPPAPGGHQANVVALNGDGQSSLFAQPAGGPTYTYDPADEPQIAISPASLAAGSEAMVEITGINTAFADGQTVVGFGSSDIAVRRIWVTGPNRLLANVSVSPSAAAGATHLTVATGLRTVTNPFGFQVTPAPSTPNRLMMVPPVTNAVSGTTGVWAGGTGVLNVRNLSAPASAVNLRVGDQQAFVISANAGQITFQVPATLPLGPAVVRLQVLGYNDPIPPVLMNVDPPPPVIVNVYSSPGVAADATLAAKAGSILGLVVAGLPASVLSADPASVRIHIGTADLPAFSVGAVDSGVMVQLTLTDSVPRGSQIPVWITYQGITSLPATISIE